LPDAQLPATCRPKALLMPSLGNDLAELTFGDDLSDPKCKEIWRCMLALLNKFRIVGHRKSNLPRIIAQQRRGPGGFRQTLPRPE
jgi:hypothetical protein